MRRGIRSQLRLDALYATADDSKCQGPRIYIKGLVYSVEDIDSLKRILRALDLREQSDVPALCNNDGRHRHGP